MTTHLDSKPILTSDKERLSKELLSILNELKDSNSCVLNLKKFLGDNENDKDLKSILDHTQYENGKTPLHYVAELDCSQAIELLLKAGAGPDVKDKDERTPLHFSNGPESIKALLDVGHANPNAQDKDGQTPLHHFAVHGYQKNVELLLGKGADPNIPDNHDNTPFHSAITSGDGDIVGLFLDDDRTKVDYINKETGQTPIFDAVAASNGEILDIILKSKKSEKIDLNIQDKKGRTVLHEAAFLAHSNCIKLLLEKGVDIDIKDKEDNDPLHFAASNECPQGDTVSMIDALIEEKKKKLGGEANIEKNYVNVKNKYGYTPLFFAVERGKIEAVKYLLKKGADTSVRGNNGYTVFHYAVKIKSLEMLKILLPKKEKKDENGVTVIEENGLPVEEIDAEKAKELLSVIDKEGNTLLHHAVSKGCSEEMIDFLVEYGVDVNKKNNNRVAPIHIAAKYGHPDLISCLMKNKANCSTKCGNLTKSHIDSIGREFPVVMKYINVQGSDINNSTVNTENDNAYREATPILIAADSDNTDAVNILASWGAKHDTQDDKGWDTLLIAIKRACSKDLIEEEKQNMCKVIGDLASAANSKVLACLADMKRQVLEEQLRDRIKSLATSRLNDNNEILNVSVLPQVTGGRLGNLIQMSIEAKRSGQEKRYISKLFSKDKLLESITDKEIQMYEKRVFNKLKNIIENTLKLSNDDEVQKIVKEAFHGALSAIESRNSTTALVDKNTDFDDNFYEKIGSGVKEIPELHYDTCTNIEEENTESSVNQKKELSPEMDRSLKEFRDNINEFWKNAEDAIREGKLESLEVDNTTFFLECSEDSIVEIAKITDGARDLGLTQGDMAFGSNIVKIGKSEVKITTQKGIRNYTDLADNSDIALTFSTSLGELKVNLYPDKQDKDKIIVEVSDKKEILEKFKNCKEEIGKNCLLGGRLVYDAIKQGYFERSGKLCQSLETISLSKKFSEGVKAAVKGLKCGDIVSSPSSNIFPSKAIMQEGKTRA